jgi:hypothetical protein
MRQVNDEKSRWGQISTEKWPLLKDLNVWKVASRNEKRRPAASGGSP